MHSQWGKQEVLAVRRELNGSILWETSNTNLPTYELSIIGILLTNSGEHYEQLLIRYLGVMRDLYHRSPEKTNLSRSEIKETLSLDDKTADLLGVLVRSGHLFSRSASFGPSDWQSGVLDAAEDFPPNSDLLPELERIIFGGYEPNAPVGYTERIMDHNRRSPNLDPNLQAPQTLGASNPLHRRYQVFVSSTFEDLKEERQHVIQALLETLCIPSGMELFPATSTTQWDLIRRVISDCDYYVLIIAGRYGSLTPDGQIGYTEREFDYALELGKPVIAFLHENIDNLTGAKLEKSDVGRKRLAQFREKAKQRMCRFWSTPDGLGSAIKSAIISAIQHDPQPGWVRSTSILEGQDAIAKLQQRIVELERTNASARPKDSENLNGLSDTLNLSLTGHYYLSNNPNQRLTSWNDQHPFELEYKWSWNRAFSVLAPKLEESASVSSLKRTLEARLATELLPKLNSKHGKHAYRPTCVIQSPPFDGMLRALQARNLIKTKPSPKGSRSRKPHWTITPTGSKLYAQLATMDEMNDSPD